jgi:hypothetical protein
MRRLATTISTLGLIGITSLAHATDETRFDAFIKRFAPDALEMVNNPRAFSPKVACVCTEDAQPGFIATFSGGVFCMRPQFSPTSGELIGALGCVGNAYEVIGK